jgi:hypothetical protein
MSRSEKEEIDMASDPSFHISSEGDRALPTVAHVLIQPAANTRRDQSTVDTLFSLPKVAILGTRVLS